MNNNDHHNLPANVSTVTDLLDTRSISWGEYQEDMPYSGFEGSGFRNRLTGANDYVRKHNPLVSYQTSLGRAARMKNLTMFYRDLESGALPQWMFITPNMTSDGHDTSVTVAGAWTRAFMEPLLRDRRFMNHTAVFITFDENGSYARQNRVVGILVGDAIPAELVGTEDAAVYNHYSEIASVSANWDLPTLGRWDVGANVWKFIADKTGDKIREWKGDVPLDRMYWNQSYDGPYNDIGGRKMISKPNLDTGKNGRSVLAAIRGQWTGSSGQGYYEDKVEVPDGLRPPKGYGVGR
jgi:hypothetical protein